MTIDELKKEFQDINLHLDEESKNVRDLEHFNELYDSFFNALGETQDAILKYLKSN
ncbi:hypothetical protein [Megasphaera sueciensis]|uniref:hypothetical protein n=1 Tax=Megasphaera sueciensis TaxID=349094 RepID=UPI003D018D46